MYYSFTNCSIKANWMQRVCNVPFYNVLSALFVLPLSNNTLQTSVPKHISYVFGNKMSLSYESFLPTEPNKIDNLWILFTFRIKGPTGYCNICFVLHYHSSLCMSVSLFSCFIVCFSLLHRLYLHPSLQIQNVWELDSKMWACNDTWKCVCFFSKQIHWTGFC